MLITLYSKINIVFLKLQALDFTLEGCGFTLCCHHDTL